MRKCAVNSILILVICFVKAAEQASISIESECISNPTLNPKLCIKRINDIMKRLNKVGPEVRLNQQGKDLLAGSRLFRKNAVMLQDVPLDDDLDPQTKKLISNLRGGISVKNEVSGDNVNFNQDLAQLNQLIRRIAIKNDLSGNVVNTKQNIKEINSNKRTAKRNSNDLEEALEDVAQALKSVTSSNQNSDESIQQVAKALQRLAVQNNIKGNKVNTKQEVEEYNDELVAATALAVMNMVGKKPTKKINAELSDIANTLRRVAIKNDINGINVNTKQDISEYNDEVVKTIVMALRRLAIKNDISGDIVNTDQNIKEFNDNPVQAISEALQRLAVLNKISGKVVNTEQDISEVNNDDPQSFTSQSDAKVVLSEVYKPFEKFAVKENRSIKASQSDDQLHIKVASPPIFMSAKSDDESKAAEDELQQAQEDFIGNGQRGVYFVETPVNNIVGSVRNIRTYEDQLRAQRIDLLKRLQPSLFMDESENADDELEGQEDEKDDADDDNNEEENDEWQESLAENQQDENQKAGSRRMTINNNMNQHETRRLVVDNKIHGNTVNTKLHATEHNNETKKAEEPIQAPKNAVISQTVAKKPKNPKKETICKTVDGKKISNEDLKNFLDLLEKLKASQKITDLMTVSKS